MTDRWIGEWLAGEFFIRVGLLSRDEVSRWIALEALLAGTGEGGDTLSALKVELRN